MTPLPAKQRPPQEEVYVAAPFLLICDVSKSMGKSSDDRRSGRPIDQLNKALRALVSAISRHHAARERAILGIISFGEMAEACTDLAYGADLRFDDLELKGSKTDFARPLYLAKEILEHIPYLTTRCYRPVVFFLSDGGHNISNGDGTDHARWKRARETLLDENFVLHPTICTFKFGDINTNALEVMASDPSLARVYRGTSEEVIKEILDTVLKATLTLSDPLARSDSDDDLAQDIKRVQEADHGVDLIEIDKGGLDEAELDERDPRLAWTVKPVPRSGR